GGSWTEHSGSGVAVFIRSDVDHAADNSRKATLVRLWSIGVVARIYGRTAAEECVRKREAAVVLQRTQLQLRARHIEPVVWPRRNQDVRPANQVEATGGDGVCFNAEEIKAGCVPRHNRVLQFQRSYAIKNGTARLQGSLGGCVGGDGAVVQRHRTTADVNKAAAGNGVCRRSSCARRGGIAADGAVFQGHRAVRVGDAAAVACAAG